MHTKKKITICNHFPLAGCVDAAGQSHCHHRPLVCHQRCCHVNDINQASIVQFDSPAKCQSHRSHWVSHQHHPQLWFISPPFGVIAAVSLHKHPVSACPQWSHDCSVKCAQAEIVIPMSHQLLRCIIGPNALSCLSDAG